MSISTLAVVLVAFLHVVFFILESVIWTAPSVARAFGNTAAQAEATRVLAFNQGCYNLGAAALLLGFLATANHEGVMGVLLFLAIMGVVGAASANWRIFILQSVPALIAGALITLF